MKHLGAIVFIAVFFILLTGGVKGQAVTVTNRTNTTPNLAANYTSLASAISDLNAITAISGPVTITLNTGNPETAPVGGYAINFTTITNNSFPVIISGSNNTVKAFGPQAAGALNDAIFKIIGADNITIQDFVMIENTANTTTTAVSNNMTEWGVALLYRSAADGAQNNTIQNNTISLSNLYQNSFGIYSNTRHTAINVGTPAEISNGTTAPNKNNKVYGNSISNVNMGICFIGSGTAANMDTGNDIGGGSALTGNTITNWGGAIIGVSTFFANSSTFYGIYMKNQKGENISYNTITSSTISGTTTSTRGIYKDYNSTPTGPFTTTITNNTISITDNNASGNFDGIRSDGITAALATATINITGNTFLNNIAGGGAPNAIVMTGIINTSRCGVLNINNNIIRSNTTAATTGSFTAISNTDSVQTTLNINNNQVGNASGNAITFSVANTAASTVYGINVVAASTAAVSISNNNIQGIVHNTVGSWTHIYINLYHPASFATTDNINDNTFTNLTANTSGSVTFINRSGAMNSGPIENCNNNKIITAFSKPVAGGTVSLYNASSGSLTGSTMIQTGNDFSNGSITGATGFSGWNNSEGTGTSGPTKTISNNIFNNWTLGSSGGIGIQSNDGGVNTIVSGNTISNISASGALYGILLGNTNTGATHTCSGNTVTQLSSVGGIVMGITGGSSFVTTFNINNNIIGGLSATGSGISCGIDISGGLTVNCFKNKIYDVSGTNTASLVYGIRSALVANGVANINNNLVGDIKAPAATVDDAVTGIRFTSIAATSPINVYYNTIYLNAVSTGANFGSSGIRCIGGTGTMSVLTLRNNIIVNTSTANGTGLTVAYRRSGTSLNNFALASNTNIYYAGIASAKNLIFNDGTNSDQTFTAYKSRVSTREANSFTELPPFLSTSGASANFLHIDPLIATRAESRGVNISGYTDDFDGNIRQGNAGYAGTGTAPDIGADEIEGVFAEVNAPVITYTAISSPSCTLSGMTITGVTITDATGIPLTGTLRPRIYYRKNAGAWFSQPGTNTGGTATNSTWSFSIVETDMGGVAAADVVSYYIIAQDIVGTPSNLGSNPSAGLEAYDVNIVITPPTTPNTYTLGYNLNGIYTVGIGGNFTTLTTAVNAYNTACPLSGAVTFELIDNSYPSETFPITINNRVDASPANTLTIRPSATATPVITGTSVLQTINLNGARYIRFDGRQGGAGTGKLMTISNSAGGITINFINDAQNNFIKYCIVKGQKANSVSGTIVFATAAASGTGNDDNIIDNNDIREAGSFSNIGIYSNGTAGKENDNITISNNNISNYYNATANTYGIYVSTNSSGWTITGNRFFQTATRLYTAASNHFGIYINTGTGYTITNNTIGFANESGTGTTNMIGNSVTLAGFPSPYSPSGTPQSIRYLGIGMALGLVGTPSTVDGNTIGGFAMYTSNGASTLYGMFGGIYVESGTVNIGVNAANIIGATTGNNSIYVATSNATGTIVGIRASCIGTSAIQNNSIGSITVSGTSSGLSGNFIGINIAGSCIYTISNNSIGNADADNIRIGYTTSGANLSNAGTLTVTDALVTATVRGIISTSTGNALSITNNTLRGWSTSCRSTPSLSGIESSGAMNGVNPSVNVNNNFLGTSATNWLNATVDNIGSFYGITMGNTGATVTNIKNNDIRGTMFGAQNAVGGGLIKLTGASSANNIATISGNTFTNLNFRFSTGDLYFIFTNYTLSSTGQLIIDNNKIVGTFNATGTSTYHMINCLMSSALGSKADITNNDFSNLTAATGFTSQFFSLYTSFGVNPCTLTVTGNKLSNWSSGNGFMAGIDISDMTGTATCSNNTISNIACRGYITGISLDPSGGSGQFNITNNIVSGLVSTGAGGYINGITANISPVNATQTNIDNNIVSGLSSTNVGGAIAGIYLDNGHASATVSVTKNKIYDLQESATGSNVYGINNFTSLKGNITYTNNYIGDLRAPSSNVTLISGPAVAGIRLYMIGGQSNVYYNTIHLNATGSAAQFSTAAVYADPATQVTLRNNIFSNVSSHGPSGKTVAYWRGDTNLGTYDAASNNNLFYAGTASAQNLVFYDGTNNDQTLAAYKTRVSPRDKLSTSALQNFISTTGSNANFLHINTTGNCSVNAKGSNAGILLATDYDNETRSTTSPFVTDIGADEFSKKNGWTGANGTNWNDAGNWSEGIVPNADDDNVVISTPPVNQPVIAAGETYQVASVIMGTGASLTNKGILKIAGSVYASTASINNMQAGIAEGSVEMNGNCSAAQDLAGNVFVNNNVKNLKVSNDVNISGVSGEHLNIIRALSFGAVTGKTLNTGDNIVLRSTATATANVGDVTGNFITGKATVERYINTGLIADGRHLKSWQFLATPTTGQTIFQSWQESGTTPAGYGTIVTGTGTGFDFTTSTPSMKFYDYGTNGWTGVTNTGNLINDKRGYMIFVRGDRSVTLYNQDAVPTTLRTKGTLFQPAALPPVTTVQAGKLESVGNPYASAIDVSYMKNNGLFVNLDNNITVWDPLLAGTFLLGGYQTLSAANNYEPTAGSTPTSYYPTGVSSPFIQSGQAFFVRSSGPVGTVTFNEACKADTNRLVNRPGLPNLSRQYFRATLFTSGGVIADGNAVVFSVNFHNSIDADDAYKILNGGENFGMTRDGRTLAVEARGPVSGTDTIFYNISNLRKQSYQLRFAPKNMQAGIKAFLIDRYLHSITSISLSDSSFVDININDDALSYAPDRFFVVFRQSRMPIPDHIAAVTAGQLLAKTPGKAAGEKEIASISVYPNPVENKILQLHFIEQAAGAYHLQLINNLGQPVYTGNTVITNSNSFQSIKIDPRTAAGNYLLNIYAENGKKTVLQVIIK